MIRVLVYLALFAAAADAACSNGCSGHGTCGDEDLCKCFPRWTSPDCSTRECPYGPSWVAQLNSEATKQIGPATGVLGGRHGYTVCSSKGECNADSGECDCFAGYTGLACSRQSCPEDCSGHGRCVTNVQMDPKYTYANSFVSEFWDAEKARLCACDRGWQGYACDERICPVGADPLTCAKMKNEPTVQRITLKNMDFPFAKTAKYKVAITLTFKDMFNGEYTTQPIRLKGRSRGLVDQAAFSGSNYDLRPCVKKSGTEAHAACSQSGAWTALNQYDAEGGKPFVAGAGVALEDFDANRIRYALEALPNFAIPMVNVTDVYPLDGNTKDVQDLRYNNRWYFDVTFTHSANAGAQELMTCTISSPASDNAAASPRMGSPTIWEHTNSVEKCYDVCAANKMFRVDLLSDGSSACSTAQNQEACNGYCTWTGDVLQTPNAGYCTPTRNSCLRDSGDGYYRCDGAKQGVPLFVSNVNHKGTACGASGADTEISCTGSCYWDASTTTCADSIACASSDMATAKVAQPAGCPTKIADLIQGNALFTTNENVYTGNKMSFENGNTKACVGGLADNNLCTSSTTLATCNGDCVWDASTNLCSGSKYLTTVTANLCATSNGNQATCNGACVWNAAGTSLCVAPAGDESTTYLTTSTGCITATTQALCTGSCDWRRAKVAVQNGINVDMWWSKPKSLNAASNLKLESSSACSTATLEKDCNGGCYYDASKFCSTVTVGALLTGVGGATGLACKTAITQAACTNTCTWGVRSTKCVDRELRSGAKCSTVSAKADCNGGCWWGGASCTSATAMRRTAPTCEVSAVATPKPAATHICSNRGVCDESTGLCGCFEGFAGEDCALQSIYF